MRNNSVPPHTSGENPIIPTVEDLLDWLAVTHIPDENFPDAIDRLMRIYRGVHARDTLDRIKHRFVRAWARLDR
ncbi:hypothetical protein [Phaeovulum sp. NW3]|uniref:hypothetical protein n=1 Tax=Phaeovulum sp. NW3 TaxID=2934933 RepID=UPI0020214F5C|nr:hypothetical protein [Phaeovulum sp. NW3]MCL7466313.1 hypothetical protein [Phaeovulum sp. NW3]